MPILLPSDTTERLGENARLCHSRSLFMDRFADPTAKENDRKNWFNRLIGLSPEIVPRSDWSGRVRGALSFHAQLMGRLMVNMAGGVMENAGLCLDRFGLPYIPGSTLKGCARRMATQKLLEARMPDDKADILFRLALVFGWGEADWKPGRRKGVPLSDLWWAMAEDSGDHSADALRDELWTEVVRASAKKLRERLGKPPALDPDKPWKDLSNFAGLVSFLPAGPVDATGVPLPLTPPPTGRLELDVLTCHHSDYYGGKQDVALDDESPNPVLFPAVAAGHVFRFTVTPLRDCESGLLGNAKDWLTEGLALFGLGAKTAAGYGWFECDSLLIEEPIRQAAASRQKAAEEAERNRVAREQAQREEQERIRRKQEAAARRSELSPEAREDLDLDEMERGTLLKHIEKLEKHSAEKQAAIYRLLQTRNVELWQELKAKAERGKPKEKKRFNPVVQMLFKMAKDRKEKMPK